jgi:hypothetical protein
VLRAVVHPANSMDRDGVTLVLHESITTDFPRLRHVWLASAYNGKGKARKGQGLDRADLGLERADRCPSAAVQEGLGSQGHSP